MKKLLLTALFVCTAYLTADAGSSLKIRNTKFDFGWMPHNSIVVHHYWFVSVGKDTLRIQEINTRNRDIAWMPLEQNWIAPGDSLRIPIYWTTGNKGRANERRWKIHTNSYVDDPLDMYLKGITVIKPDSLRPVLVKPYKGEFSRLAGMSIDSIGFTLTNYSTRELDLTVTSEPMYECEVVMPDSLHAGEERQGYIKIRSEYLDKEFLNSITIHLTDYMNYDRRITIPIRRKIYSR